MIVVISYGGCKYQKSAILYKDSNTFRLLLFRSFILVIHGMVMAGVQFYLPIPITHTLGCTGPLFMFGVQYLFGGAKINQKQIIGAATSFIGIIFVANGR